MGPTPRTSRAVQERFIATWKWIARKRRTALPHLLRGAFHGAGTGAVPVWS
ncbi:hypothetical protein [Streptomyces sp. NPDC051014]|uniref:hypothetical protein n=1 Tax=Streptomyces sp. NPDC051014 TaxID=3155751 RepID=UPI0034067757